MKVVILCGGKGVRAFPFSDYLPKPMMPVGGAPILVHILRLFMAQGFDDFVLAAGHRRRVLDDYFEGKHIGARVDIVDTGEDADTGDRLLACRERLDGDLFLATYGDGLADIPLGALLDFHRRHGGLATMTCAPLYSQYGVVDIDAAGRIERMREKPLMKEHWINAGFFVFDRRVFGHWSGHNLERDVFPALIGAGLAFAYRHDGFFKSLDNYKDQVEFEQLLGDGARPPWLPGAARDPGRPA
jgi:glucose-1-phosphate cytidylyltransferase